MPLIGSLASLAPSIGKLRVEFVNLQQFALSGFVLHSRPLVATARVGCGERSDDTAKSTPAAMNAL